MQTDFTPVLAIFCGMPLVLFWAGFFVGRWSKGIRVTRVDQAGVAVNDTRYSRAGASAPDQTPVKRIMTANRDTTTPQPR